MIFPQRLACLLALAALPALAEPGPARLVADLESGNDPAYQAISGFQRVGNRAVFAGTSNEGLPSLWVTDGTAEGTIPLAAVCPPCAYAEPLGSTGSVAFYRASDPMPVWRTDGTPEGTFPVASGLTLPPPGTAAAALGNRLFFTACSPELGCELWSSDGSAAGTAPVGELVPGPEGAFISQLAASGGRAFLIAQPEGGTALDTALWIADEHGLRRLAETPEARDLAVQGGRAWFVARGARSALDEGFEVWTSDGTEAGTRPVTSFGPADPFPAGRFQSDPFPETFSLTLLDGRAYFVANDGAHGRELWSAGPRPGDARRVTNVPGRFGAFGSVAKAGDRILFIAAGSGSEARLWSSRGDLRSSAQLTGCPGGCPVLIGPPAPVSPGRWVFYGHRQGDGGIWVTDGTAAGTRLLRRSARQWLSQAAPADGRVLLQITDEYELGDLWVTDGTAAGTFRAAHGGPTWSHYYGWRGRLQAGSANGRIVFPGLVPGDQGSEALWRSDGSPADTAPVTASQEPRSSFPEVLAVFQDGLLVQTCSNEGAALWFVQGTSADLLLSGEPGYCNAPFLSSPVVLGETAVFLRYQDGQSVWRTDGTPEGTAVLVPRTSHPMALARLGGEAAIWLAIPTTTGFLSELWLTDGTPAGTRKQLDLPPGTNMSGLAAVAGRLWFYDWVEGAEPTMRPWVSDGTPAGTHPLTEATGFTAGGGFTEMGGRVWFPFGPAGSAVGIWSTDGTPAGTRPAVTAASGAVAPQILTAIGDRLYLAAPRTEGSAERLLPWVSDGTDEGTELLVDAVTDTSFKQLGPFTELDGRVLFAASDRQHGDELWSTDGTPEGTARLLDIAPGLLGSNPRDLTVWNGRLWFRARDGVHGMELWSSDGTAEGTRMVQDIAPGASWSTPMALTVTEDGLYFSAHDGAHGRELWVLPEL